MLKTFITAVLSIAFMGLSGASEANMQPAMIGNHEDSLANRIKFPNVEGNNTWFVRCEAKVLPAGSVEEVGCYSDDKVPEAFARAVSLGANNATMTPAIVDGENVSVLALFSVVFKQQDGQRVVAVVPNHGTNAKALGMNYIAPQRYGRGNRYHPRGEVGLLWIDAKMGADGKASDISYIRTKWSNKEGERYAKRYIKDNTFIPGHQNGEPTEMRFVKPIYGYRNGFLVDVGASKCGDSTLQCDEVSNATGKPRFVFDD